MNYSAFDYYRSRADILLKNKIMNINDKLQDKLFPETMFHSKRNVVPVRTCATTCFISSLLTAEHFYSNVKKKNYLMKNRLSQHADKKHLLKPIVRSNCNLINFSSGETLNFIKALLMCRCSIYVSFLCLRVLSNLTCRLCSVYVSLLCLHVFALSIFHWLHILHQWTSLSSVNDEL